MRHLSDFEVDCLEAFAEAVVPGAREAGIAQFVDANLQRSSADALLTIRYLDVPPPYFDFYAGGLAALEAYAQAQFAKPFAALGNGRMEQVIAPMLAGGLEGWDGPPQALFYLAIRSDAADLVYGTVDAFERLSIPYVPHLEPPSRW